MLKVAISNERLVVRQDDGGHATDAQLADAIEFFSGRFELEPTEQRGHVTIKRKRRLQKRPQPSPTTAKKKAEAK